VFRIFECLLPATVYGTHVAKLNMQGLFTFSMHLKFDEKARPGVLVPIIVSGTFVAPKFRPDIKRIITQQIDKGILESEPAKKILEKDEVKKIEEPAKRLLKDLLKKP